MVSDQSLLKKVFPDNTAEPDNQGFGYQKFILLSSPRSGSSWLAALLRSHSNTVMFTELFKDGNIGYSGLGKCIDNSEELTRYRDRAPLKFIDNIIFRKYPQDIKAVGFKIHCYYQPTKDPLLIWSYLHSIPDIKIIFLKRKNYLKQMRSFKLAKITNSWSANKKEKIPVIKIRLEKEECSMFFKELEIFESFFEQAFKNKSIYRIYYEDLLNNFPNELDKIQSFLGFNKDSSFLIGIKTILP